MRELKRVSESEVDNYLKENDVRVSYHNSSDDVFMPPAVKQVESINYLKDVYISVMENISNLELWKNIDYANLEQYHGLFVLNKMCVIGSDIINNGLLAPLQMKCTGDNTFVAHPGGDRIIMLSKMSRERVPVIWDVKDYWTGLPEVAFERVKSLDIFKSLFKNWDTSLLYIGEYSLLDDTLQHDGLMKTFIGSIDKSRIQPEFITDKLYQRLEVKNSKILFNQIARSSRFFSETLKINSDSVAAGPWTLYENGSLVWDKNKIWNLHNYT